MLKPGDILDTYCVECDMPVDARIEQRTEIFSVRGEDIEIDSLVAVCPHCHAIIGDSRVEEINFDTAYDIYRKRHNLVSVEEIKELRKRFGMSVREFSKFLGLGEQTYARYEAGQLPSNSVNTVIRLAMTVDGAQQLLESNQDKLGARSINKIRAYISSNASPCIQMDWHDYYDELDILNGYKRLDLEKLSEVAYILASKCKDLYWTKFQKAMWYADSLYFERNTLSLTGMRYIHNHYGPTMEHKELFRYLLSESGAVVFEEAGFGNAEVLQPGVTQELSLSSDEMDVVNLVVEFVNSFDSANEISEYSHELKAWKDTGDKEPISYGHNLGEIADSISKRMLHVGGLQK